MTFVLDNSVVCGWMLGSRGTAYSAAIARRLETERAIAPALLKLEWTNILRKACKRQRTTAQQAQEMLTLLNRLPIDTDNRAPDTALLLKLALNHDLSTYDALYLELALRLQLPIATQDSALTKAARVAGVGVVGN